MPSPVAYQPPTAARDTTIAAGLPSSAHRTCRRLGRRVGLGIALVTMVRAAHPVLAQSASSGAASDRRVDLAGGHWVGAASAIKNLTLVGHHDRPPGFINPGNLGDFSYINSDLAFSGRYVFQGNFHGIQIWDVSEPTKPTLRNTIVCPGGQGDPSVYGHLMFVSVEMLNGRVDCGTHGVTDTASPARFRGVRIFDISDIDHPRQVADVQTCRGSHTHTLLPDPHDSSIVYVYVQGTAGVRPASELAGCSGLRPEQDPNTSLFRIEIIRVPVAHPEQASIVNRPRIFASGSAIDGLAKPVADSTHGHRDPLYHATAETDQCHDITVYPAIGLAAGACSGNGILLDIRDPAAPKRIAEVSDPNFAYWHSATFNNDGSKVIYTDEWGGGVGPKCRASDPQQWGADAIFTLSPTHSLRLASYYKLPAPQSEFENCVAHNGSLIPVPGRDILVQAWYQGGMSVYDFTDAAHPQEIAYFDRGPVDGSRLVQGGQWSSYWYDGYIYGSEIARGLDILALEPSEFLTQHEIDAAKLVHVETSNPSDQQRITWPASFVVARAYLDQLKRDSGMAADEIARTSSTLDSAEQVHGHDRQVALQKLARALASNAKHASDGRRVGLLVDVVRQLSMPTP